ncbi:efflux RND transporter periplasmic adaptor subunit [Lyticum sinuosum]|uniref:RND family efflux transporter n=1 Tax=Lyticum sinuosum TaxID=1332059 RepID=A0AAE4VK30_9RICK|nr:efflux RND transporter periplasmic adaptor subunit [Lyticum sinuosum]MDZ5760970.1 RND family efflux transporter [Lyticum sinuosum]
MPIAQKSLKELLKNIIIAIILVFLLLVIKNLLDKKHDSNIQIPSINVTTQKIIPKDQELELIYTGRVAGYKDVDIRSQVTGELQKILYNEGELILEKQPIFVIDPVPFKENIKKAKSNLNDVTQILDFAKNNLNRSETLFSYNAISKEEFEKVKTQYQTSLSNFQKAKADLLIAEKNLTYAEIRSPITGIIGEKQYSEGNLITANSQNVLTKILQIDPVYIYFSYSDKDMSMLRDMRTKKLIDIPKNFEIDIFLENGNKFEHKGKVDYIDSKVNQDTSSIELRAVVANKNYHLLPGEFVKVSLRGIKWKEAITIPDSALLHTSNGVMVYILNNKNIAEIRPVTIGPLTKNGRIITSGLQNGDIIIKTGLIKLRPGAQVSSSDNL